VLYYFAYGSNLHPVRLTERVPSAQLLGIAQLHRYTLKFHKQGQDGSGKCSVLSTGVETDKVYGAIYSIDPAHKKQLDEFEGEGYRDESIELQYQDKSYQCFIYIAHEAFIDSNLKPYHWYRDLVLAGARFLQFPENYVAGIEDVTSTEDPDRYRVMEHTRLLTSCHY